MLCSHRNFPLSALSPQPEPTSDSSQLKTSHAEITLKSATLPRRKPVGKAEIQVEIKPRVNIFILSSIPLHKFSKNCKLIGRAASA